MQQQQRDPLRKSNCTETWFSTEGAYHEVLGSVLHQQKFDTQLKHTVQAITHMFPTQRWVHAYVDPRVTPSCKLCGYELDSVGHFQCRCTALKRARIQAHHRIWNGIVDGIRSATVRRNSTLITELSTPNIIAALQQDTTQTVVQLQLQEGIAQLPEDVWEVSNLEAPDKRTRDTAKLETEEPAPQRRRQIDPIKELLRPSKRVVRRKATQRKKKMRQVILDSIFTTAQSEAVRSKRPPTDYVNIEDDRAKRRNIATTSPPPDQHTQDSTTVADSLIVSSARTKRKDKGADIGSRPSPVPQPPDASRLHLSYVYVGLVRGLLA